MSTPSINGYAQFVGRVLTEELDLRVVAKQATREGIRQESPVERISRIFLWHARRTGCEYEELGALLFLELAKEGRVGQEVTEQFLHNVLTRIRMRVLRDARKTVEIAKAAEQKASLQRNLHAREWTDLTSADLAERLDTEKLLIAMALLQGGSKTEIASRLGMSRATFYRKCEELRRHLAPLLETGGPADLA